MTEVAVEISGPVRGGRRGAPFDISRLDLPALGYTEEEYFLSGAATSYRKLDAIDVNRWDVASKGKEAFRTRMLVRRPADPRRFNGTIVVEWLNVSAFMDASVEWTYLHTELIRGGYAWAGVSAQRAGVTGSPYPGQSAPGGLTGWDPDRYGGLDHPGDDYAYDIFTQAGHALRAARKGEPLGDLAGARLIAAGQSLGAYWLATYVNAVDPIARRYDGFLLHSRPGGAAPVELPAVLRPRDATSLEPVPLRRDPRVPVLALQTETDVVTLGHFRVRRDDTERLRLWEVAGTAHADTYAEAGISDTGDLPADVLARALRPRPTLVGTTQDHLVNAAPQNHYVANAAIAALHSWVHDGSLPPAAPRLDVIDEGDTLRLAVDEHGNATGGIRTPWVDVPIATLSGISGGTDPLSILLGVTRPFPPATLQRLYPDQTAYLNAFQASLRTATTSGFILPTDNAEILALAAEQHRSAHQEAERSTGLQPDPRQEQRG
jgi:hypothetical protein